MHKIMSLMLTCVLRGNMTRMYLSNAVANVLCHCSHNFCVMCQEYVVVMYLRRNSIRSGVESGVECSETSDASEDACIYRRMRLETNAFPDACASRRISLHIPT